MLTRSRLKDLLDYDPDTGIFLWKVSTAQRIKVGDVAGCVSKKGYIHIKIDNKSYRAHRLAWLDYYGYFPERGLDHKDRTRHHNWIDNLREVGQQCNVRNTGNLSNNTSGVKGIFLNKKAHKWRASIKLNGKLSHLGYSTDFTEAVARRLAAEQCLNWSNCDSSSPAYQYMQKYIGETP